LQKKLAASTDKGDLTESRELLRTMGQELGNPESTTKYKWEGYLALREKRYVDAENFYRRALGIKPTDFVSSLNLAYALMGQDKRAEAAGIYRRLVERFPMDEKVLRLGEALGQH